MISNLMLIIGVGVLAAALRSFQNPILFRLGTLGIVATSFLAGWLLGGSVWIGVLLSLSWLLLPWLEILTRVRRLRLPLERTLERRTPPNRSTFPGFSEMSAEIEELGFEHVSDIGWEYDQTRHFYRVFSRANSKTHASICLTEQSEFSFYYLTLTSRTADGRIFVTWNYPFSYGLKMEPHLEMNRYPAQGPFEAMQKSHEKFLSSKGVDFSTLIDPTPDETVGIMQSEMRAQITHNIDLGLLKRDGEHFIRYTVRGMFFLWFQFLRDLVRFS